jgi:hypothetical protein
MATQDYNSIEPTVLSDTVPVLERSSVRIPILKRLIADCDRDNLRRSADGLRAHLAKAEQALRELGEALDSETL